MITATFHFKPNLYTPRVTFYVSEGGDLHGAACYFFNMVKSTGTNLPDKFCRGNLKAEVTYSQESHVDTTYRYTLYTHQKKIYVETSLVDFPKRKSKHTLTEFISKHLKEKNIIGLCLEKVS